MVVRKPAVAGQFYPGTKKSLEEQLSGLITNNKNTIEAKGIILPHAGYMYSGGVAGAVIGKIKPRSSYIIIGPNHTGIGKTFSIISEGTWQTPLAEVEIDSELSQKLLEKSTLLEEDISAQRFEHSIEVELPFLQFINPEFKFIPIVLGPADLASYKKLGQEIADSIKDKKDITIVASSDFTHYESQDNAKRKDKLAIDAILNLDCDLLWERISKENISMCGYAPCIAMIYACRKLAVKNTELVLYQTSGDITGDKSSVVGYAGIIIK